MTIKTLYKYRREDGGITVSPHEPDGPYELMYRLIADDGKALTQDGETLYLCIDVESTDDWYEVDAPEDEVMNE